MTFGKKPVEERANNIFICYENDLTIREILMEAFFTLCAK